MVREDNEQAGKIWTWKYDDAGNLTHHREYEYSDTGMDTPLYTMRYTYGDANWGDLLTAYNGVAITYDKIGNPLNDGTWTYTWQRGRQLSYMTDGTTAWSMTYDADGLRTKRVTSTGSHYYYYYYENGLLTGMEINGSILRFTYDAQGRPVSVSMDSTTYYYALNLQGDVVAIVDTKGNPVATYTYNAWGKLISGSGSKYNSIGVINPLRYRGYVYDRETGLYYLQSRYYNPELGRFINADAYLSTGQGVLGYNMFVYCNNNPVTLIDSGGNFPIYAYESYDSYAGWVGAQLGKLISDWIMGDGSDNSDGTLTIGITGSLMGGAGGSASIGETADGEGNIGVIVTGGAGGGFPYFGASGFATVTSADNIYKQEGMATSVGGSINIAGGSLGAEYQTFTDPITKECYHGGTVMVGGAASLPVESHGEVTHSVIIWSFNVRELFRGR